MEHTRHALGELTIVVVALKDRRQSRAPDELWVFQHTIQHALYGNSSSGIHRLYERASLTQAPLALAKASIAAGIVTAQEFASLISLLTETLPFESRGRVRNVTLISLNLVPVLCQKLGRSPRTTALLESLRAPLPRLWVAQAEQEANSAAGEADLLLDEEVARCLTRMPSPRARLMRQVAVRRSMSLKKKRLISASNSSSTSRMRQKPRRKRRRCALGSWSACQTRWPKSSTNS